MKLTHTEFFDTPLRKVAYELIETGLLAVDTKDAISKRVRLEGDTLHVDQEKFSLGSGRVVVLGAGKCSGDALSELGAVLGDRISVGFVIDIVNRHPGNRLEVAVGDHPFPSERNVLHTKKLQSILSGLTSDDRVIFIISGGGTVLLCDPPSGFSATDETELIKSLFAHGATIKEMNTVRKHLSFARGGFLAANSKASSLSLIFSDVPYNDISTISSGPTVKDETTTSDAVSVIKKYTQGTKIEDLASSVLIETPKDDALFANAKNILFMSNQVALAAMSDKAKSQGFTPKIVTDNLEGNAEEVGAKIAEDIANSPSKTCLLYAGETTVVIKGNGTGGRNRHLALRALTSLSENCLIGAVASDGIDNGPFAGAFVDGGILSQARAKEIDPLVYLANNDSGTFFEKVGGYIHSGPTGSNVADLIFAIKY